LATPHTCLYMDRAQTDSKGPLRAFCRATTVCEACPVGIVPVFRVIRPGEESPSRLARFATGLPLRSISAGLVLLFFAAPAAGHFVERRVVVPKKFSSCSSSTTSHLE
jgi:hypothetical protein